MSQYHWPIEFWRPTWPMTHCYLCCLLFMGNEKNLLLIFKYSDVKPRIFLVYPIMLQKLSFDHHYNDACLIKVWSCSMYFAWELPVCRFCCKCYFNYNGILHFVQQFLLPQKSLMLLFPMVLILGMYMSHGRNRIVMIVCVVMSINTFCFTAFLEKVVNVQVCYFSINYIFKNLCEILVWLMLIWFFAVSQSLPETKCDQYMTANLRINLLLCLSWVISD